MAVLAILVSMLGMGGQTALAQEEEPPPSGEPSIALINPSAGYDSGTLANEPPKVSDADDGVDQLYHLVAWTANAPANAVVEAYYVPTTVGGIPLPEVTIGALEQVAGAPDTWELYWDIPEDVNDGTGTITVRLFEGTLAGFEEVANHSVDVEMEHKDEDPPPRGDGIAAAATVELTWPSQNGELGFFKPRGGLWRSVVDTSQGEASSGSFVFYTTSDPGEVPEWTRCVSTGGRGTCTLAGDDVPSAVTALSSVTYEWQDQGITVKTEESADAHRVRPYIQDPAGMTIDLSPVSTNDTGGTYRQVVGDNPQTGEPHRCIALVAEVRDHLDREVMGASVDVHAIGPNDQVQFGDEDPAFQAPCCFAVESGSSSGYKVADRGNHQTEAAENCDRVPEDEGESHTEKPVEGQQSDHNRPALDDEKHRESTFGTGLSGGTGTGFGRWNFHLFSPTVGSTEVVAWVDDEPLVSETVQRAIDTDTLDAGEATATTTLQWLPGAITVQFDPVGDTAQVGTCNRYTVKVRGGTVPVRGINVDVHATGPNNELDFCDPGDGTPRRAPDTTGPDADHEAEDEGESHHRGEPPQTQHTEGETDDAGNFVIGITSPISGDTTLEAWVDGETGADNDVAASGEPIGRATKSWTSSIADAELSFVNPSPYGGQGTKVSRKTDVDDRYHIVTRVDATDVPGVELYVSSDSGATFTKIGDAQQVSGSDTWELYWDVNVREGSHVLRAQIAGTDRREDQTITVNNAGPAPGNPPDTEPAYETLELTQPHATQAVSFTNRETTVEGVTSNGTEGVDLFYTKVAAKDTPQSADWISCGFTQPRDDRSFSGTCRLQGSDQASSVTGIAAITYDCTDADCDPRPANLAEGRPEREPGNRESGDAHRIFGFEGRPLVGLEPAESAADRGACQRMVFSVVDETGQALAGENVDVHASGPDETLHFCDPDGGATARRSPDQGGHGAESGETDEGFHADTQPATKHTEGETNSSGRFVFGVTSATEGDTQLVAWVDQNDNDVQDDEPSDTSVVHWGRSGGGGEDPRGCTITGTSGGDVIRGTPDDDVICGLGGRDTIRGRGGNDVIYGDGGHDSIRGNAGNDRMIGGGGLDVLRGGHGHDVARGGARNDTIRGYNGNDRLIGQGGNDVIAAGDGRDYLAGNRGNDTLNGGRGSDRCRGGRGDDSTSRCER